MYDSVNLSLAQSEVRNTSFLEETASLLSNCSETRYDGGNICVIGHLGGLKVRATNKNLNIDFSLSKYYLGQNLDSLTLTTSALAIEKLSDELHLPMNRAKIKRIDVSQNLIMNEPVQAYFYELGELSRHNKSIHKNSLYFNGNKTKLIFYDKLKEAKSKGIVIPFYTSDCQHVLRYELRIFNQLEKQFNLSEVTLNDLKNEKVYMQIIDLWEENYNRIRKNKQFTGLNITGSTKELSTQLAFLGLTENGNEETVRAKIKQAQLTKAISSQEAKRLRDELKRILSNKQCAKDSELTRELDMKVAEASRYFR